MRPVETKETKCRIPIALLAVTVAMLVLAGCSKPPTEAISSANQALDEARSAEASDYAPESLAKAEDAHNQLEAELKAQEDKFAPFRSYDKAKQLAAQAKQEAETAKTDAVEGKEVARDEASAKIAQLRQDLQDLQKMLASAPRGKGTEADLAMLRSDLGGIESTLTEIDQAFGDQRYAEAIAKTESATASAQSIRQEIQNAIDLAKSRRRSG